MIHYFLVHYLPWILSFNTISVQWLAGNEYKHTWTIALLNQVLWFAWMIASESWGFFPMNLVLTFIFARNFFKWRKEGKGKPLFDKSVTA